MLIDEQVNDSNNNNKKANDNNIKFQIGDLVWAKLSGHPWWPCMVSNPLSSQSNTTSSLNNQLHYRLVGATRPKRFVYVEFYGPARENAWISESSLIEYKGVDAFKVYAQDQVDQAQAKSAKEKLADKFQLKVSLAKRDYWEKAVNEADLACLLSITERVQFFLKKINETSQLKTSQFQLFQDDGIMHSIVFFLQINK
jgi:[histone H3]-lysine36 N-dimethyltransferase NSD2